MQHSMGNPPCRQWGAQRCVSCTMHCVCHAFNVPGSHVEGVCNLGVEEGERLGRLNRKWPWEVLTLRSIFEKQ